MNAQPKVLHGVVQRVFLTRGFGFVTGEDGVEVFLHIQDMVDPRLWERLHTGVKVTFIPEKRGTKGNGLRATAVQVESV